jgi:copper oxidase (laccase) domain-containing protein
MPILVGNPRSGAVVAVHAGWRGLVLGVIESAVQAVGDARSLVCAVGPCIGPAAFEIGEDVAASFVNKVSDQRVVIKRSNALYGDLQLAAQLVLTRLGVPFSAIDRLEHCTFTEEPLFFSYRRDGASPAGGGRQLSFIAPHSRSSP